MGARYMARIGSSICYTEDITAITAYPKHANGAHIEFNLKNGHSIHLVQRDFPDEFEFYSGLIVQATPFMTMLRDQIGFALDDSEKGDT